MVRALNTIWIILQLNIYTPHHTTQIIYDQYLLYLNFCCCVLFHLFLTWRFRIQYVWCKIIYLWSTLYTQTTETIDSSRCWTVGFCLVKFQINNMYISYMYSFLNFRKLFINNSRINLFKLDIRCLLSPSYIDDIPLSKKWKYSGNEICFPDIHT